MYYRAALSKETATAQVVETGYSSVGSGVIVAAGRITIQIVSTTKVVLRLKLKIWKVAGLDAIFFLLHPFAQRLLCNTQQAGGNGLIAAGPPHRFGNQQVGGLFDGRQPVGEGDRWVAVGIRYYRCR